MTIQQALVDLGLNNKEAVIYQTLLELGESTAYAVAIKSGLKRPTVYIILDELRMRGLVLKTPHSKKQLFQAKPPDELVYEAQERTRRALSALPELLSIMASGDKPRTLYFEGVNGLKQAVLRGIDKARNHEIVGFYAYADDPSGDLKRVIDEYNEELKRNNIRVRSIVPQHPSLLRFRSEDSLYNRTVKTVPPDQYFSRVSIDVLPDSVRVIDYSNINALIIDNPNIAQTIKQIFEIVWRTLPSPGKVNK